MYIYSLEVKGLNKIKICTFTHFRRRNANEHFYLNGIVIIRHVRTCTIQVTDMTELTKYCNIAAINILYNII